MTLARSLETLEELSLTIDLVRTQRDLAVQALRNIQCAATFEEAQSIARGILGAIDACGDDEPIVITTRDYTAFDEGCDEAV